MSRGFTIKETGDEIVITIDKNNEGGISKSGKSQIVATSSGNISLNDGLKLGLNCYKPIN